MGDRKTSSQIQATTVSNVSSRVGITLWDSQNRFVDMFPLHSLAAVSILLFSAACTADVSSDPVLPPPRSLTAGFKTPDVTIDGKNKLHGQTVAKPQLSSQQSLSLRKAIQIALEQHPSLRAASLEVAARKEETKRAGLLPNPELQASLDNFSGTGALSGFSDSETTLALGQLIELGGKRSRRVESAQTQAQLAGWDFEAQRVSLYAEVTKLYVDAVAADSRLNLTENLLAVARRLQKAVDARVSAGKVSPIEKQRASTVVGRAEIDRDSARALKLSAYRRLASALNLPFSQINTLSGKLNGVVPPPPEETIAGLVLDGPAVARWTVETAYRQAELDLAIAGRIPDVTIGGGVRKFARTGDTAYVATVSVPLPIFNRNQEAVAAARDRLARSAAEGENARISAEIALHGAYAALSSAATRSIALRNRILPAARQTFEATESGYKEGKFDLVTLLDSQRTYFEVEKDAIDAATDYFNARADVEALIGRDITAKNLSSKASKQ